MIEMPLFPLSAVLLPHGRMPLRIFERRYLDLVADCMRSGEPFGVVWIRRGAEVAQRGRAAPELGDFGTTAHIVDWDQLPDGLLGITIEGRRRFELYETSTRADGLVVGQVELMAEPAPAPLVPTWQSLLDVLQSLQTHPHVERLGLSPDSGDAWQVAYSLIQLLPLDEALKYELLGIDTPEELLEQLDGILNRIAGQE
jgi:Lon protease-like protein